MKPEDRFPWEILTSFSEQAKLIRVHMLGKTGSLTGSFWAKSTKLRIAFSSPPNKYSKSKRKEIKLKQNQTKTTNNQLKKIKRKMTSSRTRTKMWWPFSKPPSITCSKKPSTKRRMASGTYTIKKRANGPNKISNLRKKCKKWRRIFSTNSKTNSL